MSWSAHDQTETQEADATHAQSLRNISNTEDLKYRAEGMIQKWIDCNGIKLKDRVWASWAARDQERLQAIFTTKLNDFLTELCGDHLAEEDQ